MKSILFVCIVFLLLLTPTVFAQSTITVTQSLSQVPLYDIEELTFSLPSTLTYSNPYDPESIDVRARITKPDGTTEEQVGFWYEQVRYQDNGDDDYTIVPNSGVWKVRYAPRHIGQYTYTIEARTPTQTITSPSYQFSAIESSNKGFLRRDPQNPYRLMYDNGEPYILLGTNQAWHFDPKSYESLFQKFKAKQLNMARVWLTFYDPSPHFQLELGRRPNYVTKKMEKVPAYPSPTPVTPYKVDTVQFKGINNYSQESAYKLDELMRYGKENNVYLMLTTWDFHPFGGDGFTWWDIDNPYRDIIGGASGTSATAFWTDPQARKYFRYYMRYLGARYGAYTSLGILEFWNELDKAPSNPLALSNGRQVMGDWHQEMKQAFQNATASKPITSTSFASKGRPDSEPSNGSDGLDSFRSIPAVDIAQSHYYNKRDDYASFLSSAYRWAHEKFARPYIMGEYGRQGEELQVPNDVTGKLPTADLEKLRRLNHHSIWNPFMHAGSAGSALFWRISGTGVIPWYGCCNEFISPPDSYLENYNRFAQWIDSERAELRSMTFFWAGKLNNIEIGGYKKSNRAIIYFYNTSGHYNREDNQISNVTSTYTLTGIANGNYTLEYTNPFTGQIVTSSTATVTNGSLALTTPPFKRDVALKVFLTNNPSSTPTSSPTQSPTPTRIPGDIDNNRTVTVTDYNQILSNIGKNGSQIPNNFIDVNGNSTVDIYDYSIVIKNFTSI